MRPSYCNPKTRTTSRLRGAISTLGLAALLATAHADDTLSPAPVEVLTAASAWGRVVGHTVTGTTPDGPYSEFFAEDGSLRIVDNDGKAGGRWSLRDAKLCTQVDDDEEECRALEVSGTSGAFVDGAGNRYRFDILPGNPKGL